MRSVCLLGWIAAAPLLAADNTAQMQCKLEFLTELGWRLERAPLRGIELQGGSPCRRTDLAAAQAEGDLVLRVPKSSDAWFSEPQAARQLDDAIADPASICAFAIRIGDATRRAADKLIANPGFKFSAIQTGWIGFGAGSAADAGWQSLYSWGRGFTPSLSNSRAIAAFYERPVRAECGVGRQIAQYAAFAELFGAAGFDRAFKPGEIVIGTFNKLGRSGSVLLGSGRGEMLADGLAKKSSALGRHAFNGAPGFIHHVFDASTLSDLNNQAQNFVVYEVDAAAEEALRTHGGFAYFNRVNRRIWELSEPFQVRGLRWFERLLFERDARLRARLTVRERDLYQRMRTLLDDPFYGGFRVYGHPHGVKPIGYFVVRMLDRNPHTPFRIELALHNLHTEIYRRYARDRIDLCVTTRRERGTIATQPE
ncbi:MAG: hypothetical protein ABIP49_02375 [Lysobacterales bacterium]